MSAIDREILGLQIEGGRDEALIGGASGQLVWELPNILRDPDMLDGELALVYQFYAACLEATRRSLRQEDRQAALRAMRDERDATIGAIKQRRIMAHAAEKDQQASERFGRGLVARQSLHLST